MIKEMRFELFILNDSTMTNRDLEKATAKKIGKTPREARKIVHAFFNSVAESLAAKDPVTCSGFGTFFLAHYPAKEIDDPRGRGHKIKMAPTDVAKFRPSGILRQKVGSKKGISRFFDFSKLFQEKKKAISLPLDQSVKTSPSTSPVRPPSLNVPPPQTLSPPQTIPPPLTTPPPPSTPPPVEQTSDREEIISINQEESNMPINPPPVKNQEKPISKKRVLDIKFRDITGVKVDKEVLSLVPKNIAAQYKVAPIEVESGKLTVAMVDPENINTIELLKKITQLEIEPVLSTSDEIAGIIDQYTALQEEVESVIEQSDLGITKKEIERAKKEKIDEEVGDSPTVRIVFSLLKRAVRERASDIHIEPFENQVVVRFRIDGILQKRVVLPKQIHSSIIARLKIMASLKIDEQRLPQDGRMQLLVDQNSIDFRFSTMPCVNGEKAVLRILDKSQGIISLEEIGVSGHGFDVLSKNIKKSHGMTLVTGPTGSGKTTTLYAVLGKLMNTAVNIVTLEDPVEYRIEDINQSQINADIGYTFASSLRMVVRQDPDIIMLGEIRDRETAEMAIHAALTGHIVLSTLHTNDASGAIPRLIDMNIEPFLIASSVNTIVGQRLTRRLCSHCRVPSKLSSAEINEVKTEIDKIPKESKKDIDSGKLNFFSPGGCDECNKNGYKGRQGVFEVLDVSDKIKELILNRSSSGKILEQARAEGMISMFQDGILKAQQGITSMEEVWRVTRE